jgi:hypothetical protein
MLAAPVIFPKKESAARNISVRENSAAAVQKVDKTA